MNPKSGKAFTWGHGLIPLVLVFFYTFTNVKQPVFLLLALVFLLWFAYLAALTFLLKTMNALMSSLPFILFLTISDFILMGVVYLLPDWNGSGMDPVWFILIYVLVYAYEFGVLATVIFCIFGMGLLYLYRASSGGIFFSTDTLLIAVGMAAGVFYVGSSAERLRAAAFYDPLTRLPNRQSLRSALEKALKRCRHESSARIALLSLDLDQFKYINDSMGHAVGDSLLKSMAERMKRAVPSKAVLARLGGDEFAIVLPQMKKPEEAEQTAKLVLEHLKQSQRLNNLDVYVSASIGIVVAPGDGRDPETLLKNAETAMYRAKELGRNNYQFYTPSSTKEGLERLRLETALRQALERDELFVYYQPRVETVSGELVGVEALVRWEHPEWGQVPPSHFIPLAEETGLIIQLGEMVLLKACRQRKLWNEQGIPPFRISVNLSPKQFRQRDLAERITSILKSTGLRPEFLELELTESAAMQDVNFAIQMLRGLKRLGLKLSIDDFGTGYSCLNYLKKLPIDVMKIDQSFIDGIGDDPDDAAIVQAIIALARTLKLSVTAEGVETSEQYAYLEQLGCDEIQGYLIAKPMSAANLEDWLRIGKALSDAGATV